MGDDLCIEALAGLLHLRRGEQLMHLATAFPQEQFDVGLRTSPAGAYRPRRLGQGAAPSAGVPQLLVCRAVCRGIARREESRRGEESGSTGRSRWWTSSEKKKKKDT